MFVLVSFGSTFESDTHAFDDRIEACCSHAIVRRSRRDLYASTIRNSAGDCKISI